MKIGYQPVSLLIVLVILVLLQTILRSILLNRRSQPGTQEHKPKAPRALKPKTEDDCPFCRKEKGLCIEKPGICGATRPWSEVRDRRGRKKTISTQGRGCNNPKCIYYHVMDECIHALVGYGSHGKHERIQDLMCQACGKKFTVRRDTILYRLKSHSEKVAQVLALMAEGVDVSTLERVLGIGEGTLRTWGATR